MEIKQRLRLDHCQLVGIGLKCVNMQLAFPCLEINIAEWDQAVVLLVWKLNEHPPVLSEILEVDMRLLIET